MKFSIRDLMFVTVIVALAVAWWMDRTKLVSTRHQLQIERIHVVLRQHEESHRRGLQIAPATIPPKP